MDKPVAESLYNQLFAISEEAFNAGLFDVAYHALMSALHCADTLPSDQPLLAVGNRAREQLAWIDAHHPEYEHSTRSASNRNQAASIFSMITSQAETRIKMRKIKFIGR